MKYQKLHNAVCLEEGFKNKLAAGALALALGASPVKATDNVRKADEPTKIVQVEQKGYNWLDNYIEQLKSWEGMDETPRHDRTGNSIGHGTHYQSWMDSILKANGTNWEQLKSGRSKVDKKLADILIKTAVALKIKELEKKFPEYKNMDSAVQRWLLDASYRYGPNAMPNFRKLVKKDHTDIKNIWKEFRNNDTFKAELKGKPGPANNRSKAYIQWYKDSIFKNNNE